MKREERRGGFFLFIIFFVEFFVIFEHTNDKRGRTTTWDETDDTKEDNNEGTKPPPNREEDEAQHLGDAGLFVLPEQTRHRGKAAEIGNGLRVYRSGELREKIIVVERERERDVVLLCGHSRGDD